jgi:hypothetical protein
MAKSPVTSGSRPYMTLNEIANAAPIPATQDMPAEIQEMLRRDSGVYVRSKSKPKMDFTTEKVPGVPGIWRVSGISHDEEFLTTIPGQEQTELKADGAVSPKEDPSGTEGYRPPWVPLEYLPRLTPFRIGDHLFLEPRSQEEGNRLAYPFRTVGKIFSSDGFQGSGVLVGPNLMLTAGHVAPWGMNPWSMEFVPAFRGEPGEPNPTPFGSSFVEAYHGYNTQPEVSGHDYIICKLYRPLGQALGWMGTQSWGNEDEYYRRRFVSSGYPASFGNRPAVELDMGVRDIDSDSPGIEIEFSEANRDFHDGWSGGPLWLPSEGPVVVAVLSGSEQDELDPRFAVFGGGNGMVDLVKFGLENWLP